jgi:CDP-diacylglycerol--glycerol-3-phosphate 3-phosphatidyltransferase
VLVGRGQFGLGGWALLFAFTCDSWDGIVARATNRCSQAGEFFDSTIDRYNDLITFLGFLYYYRESPLPLALTAFGMIGSSVVSYARAKGEAFGVNANVGYMQRHERAVWLGAATALSPIVAAYLEPGSPRPVYHLVVVVMGLLAFMTNVTALWRMAVVMRALRGRRHHDS